MENARIDIPFPKTFCAGAPELTEAHANTAGSGRLIGKKRKYTGKTLGSSRSSFLSFSLLFSFFVEGLGNVENCGKE
jgi:hypothetical protein